MNFTAIVKNTEIFVDRNNTGSVLSEQALAN